MLEVGDAITDAVLSVTKAWTKQRKAEERDGNTERRRAQRLATAEK